MVERNIEALLSRRAREERRRPREVRAADLITAFAGSMRFVYLHLVVYGAWVLVNLPWSPWRFDRQFIVLGTAASIEAIFLSTFILISQNRMTALADKRADLDLQVSLLAEHEVTRLIRLVSAVAERLGVEESRSPELGELKRDVRPEAVLDTLEAAAARARPGSEPGEGAGRGGAGPR
ncbi:hypothetical protein AMPC_26000 [Anaeromyxobacter paludicola]|uniref:DUF1003 domain-containing protein n=1 Tax=Anaeromyxobacter paludicola TaxID=2918171 RepID=A0ABN6NC12_9BACT|nr:hypothetical protein AMPC_26000 [Anaeromyxobacter paludicola]